MPPRQRTVVKFGLARGVSHLMAQARLSNMAKLVSNDVKLFCRIHAGSSDSTDEIDDQ